MHYALTYLSNRYIFRLTGSNLNNHGADLGSRTQLNISTYTLELEQDQTLQLSSVMCKMNRLNLLPHVWAQPARVSNESKSYSV